MKPKKNAPDQFTSTRRISRDDPLKTILSRLHDELSQTDETRKPHIIDRFVIKHPRFATEIREAHAGPSGAEPEIIDDEKTVIAESPQIHPGRRERIGKASDSSEEDYKQTAVRSKLEHVPRVDLPQGAPRFLGKYRVIKELGRGGMGIVYLGVEDAMARFVAIKVLPASFGHQVELLERFRREQAAISRLQHPGIIAVYTNGAQDGLHYFVMQFVHGISLTEWLKQYWHHHQIPFESAAGQANETAEARRSSLDLGEFLHIIERVANALHFAHQHGVLHRDIKPGNIMIDEEGNPILLDFGLAKNEDEQTITKSGSILGTVPYMAPEQVAARRAQIDHRVDLYALGVILFEGLTGRRPFTANEMESLMVKILTKEPPAPSSINHELNASIDTVVLKCLEKNPHFRFANCAALADELGRIRAHQSILSEPVGTFGRLMRWAANNRAQAAFAAVAIASVLFLAAFLIQGEMAARQLTRESAARQARAARRSLASAHAMIQDENENKKERQATMALPVDFDSGTTLQAIAAKIHELRLNRFRLCQDSVARFDESLKLTGNDKVRRERIAALVAWLRAAEDLQDDVTSQVIVDRLSEEGDSKKNYRSTGLLSIKTNPSGAHAKAQRWIPTPNGRLTLSDKTIDLGLTPIDSVKLGLGSWQILLSHETCNDVLYPVLIERNEHWGHADWHNGKFKDRDWSIKLPSAQSHDDQTWAFVPGGPFQQTYPPLYTELDCQLRWSWEDSFMMSKREVTFEGYLPFFEEVSLQSRQLSKDQKIACGPLFFDGGQPKPRTRIDENQELQVLETGGLSVAELMKCSVCGVQGWAANFYARVLANQTSTATALPTGSQWEKAARGVDGRLFPWGNRFDWSFTAGRLSQEKPISAGASTLPPGTYLVDQSPYGCFDMAGNAGEWCLGQAQGTTTTFSAGGMLLNSRPSYFAAWPREQVNPYSFRDHLGFRLARNLQ